jgi:hypothetical protein
MQAIDVTRHSRLTQQLVPPTTILSFVCCSQAACKKKLLMTFGTTYVYILKQICLCAEIQNPMLNDHNDPPTSIFSVAATLILKVGGLKTF